MSHRRQYDAVSAGPRSAVGSASDSRARGPGFDTRSGHILSFLLPLIQERQLSVTGERYVHEVLVNRLCGVHTYPDSPTIEIGAFIVTKSG